MTAERHSIIRFTLNQPHGPTTVVVNSCKPLSEVSKLGELSSLHEVSSSTDKRLCDLPPSPNHPPCQPVVRYPTTELGGTVIFGVRILWNTLINDFSQKGGGGGVQKTRGFVRNLDQK